MPELPEVETTKRGITPHTVGQYVTNCIVRNPQLRWPVPSNLPTLIEGKKLNAIERRGKYLLLDFDHGTLIWHLGMSGNLRIVNPLEPHGIHDHVELHFSQNKALRYNDPRRFGCVLWTDESIETHKLIQHLGPEPLTDAFDATYLYQQSRRRSQAIKTWIMDAKVVVGVGNIYANEALFAAGIHPLKPANKLSRPKSDKLVKEIKRILTNAIKSGGTTLKDFVGGDGKPGYFAQELSVYGRGGKPCRTCEKPLTEKQISQRTTVYCTQCQK